MPEPVEPVDQRALEALENLRNELPAQATPDSPQQGDRVGLGDRIRVAVVQRWPALDERPLATALTVAVAVVGLVLVGVWILASGGAGPNDDEGGFDLPFTTTTVIAVAGGADGAGSPGTPPTSSTLAALVVHAAGAVQRPGVHRVPNGARVADVLAAAGGPAADADVDRLNLAALVADGQRLYVPRIGEPSPPQLLAPGGAGSNPTAGATSGPAAPLDLNQATEQELDVLPGVGPSTAAAIVSHREANGPFRRVEDLLEVRGIGPAKLEALRDLVSVG